MCFFCSMGVVFSFSLLSIYVFLRLCELLFRVLGVIFRYDSVVAQWIQQGAHLLYEKSFHMEVTNKVVFQEKYSYPEPEEVVNYLFENNSFKIEEAQDALNTSRNKIVKISKALKELDIIKGDVNNNNTSILNDRLNEDEIESKIINNLRFKLQ